MFRRIRLIVPVLLAGILMFGLASCVFPNAEDPTPTPTTTPERVVAEAEDTDKEPSSTPTASHTPTPEPSPTDTPEPSPTVTPTATPTASPIPTEVSYENDALNFYFVQPTGNLPEDFPEDVSPLTGLPLADPDLLDLPAVLMSITNFPVSSRPQAGLSYAPHVYEVFIGEGQTRFLTVFHGEFPQNETRLQAAPGYLPDQPFAQVSPIIGNFIWHDRNQNGLQDAGERGVSGVLVNLYDAGGKNLLDFTLSDTNGYYGFNAIPGQTYVLEVVKQARMYFSPQDRGDDEEVDSDVAPTTGRTDPFLFTSTDMTIDIGLDIVPFPDPDPDPTSTPTSSPTPTATPYWAETGDSEELVNPLTLLEELIQELNGGDISRLGEAIRVMLYLAGDTIDDEDMGGLLSVKPMGDNQPLMQRLLEAAENGVRQRVNFVADRLRTGDMDFFREAFELMMLLSGRSISSDEMGGMLGVLPFGEYEDLMQILLDAAVEGVRQRGEALAQRLESGDLSALEEAMKVMMLLSGRSLSSAEMGGLLGILPHGEHEDVMQRIVDAARTAFRMRANQVADLLEQGFLHYLEEASKLSMLLTEESTFQDRDIGRFGLFLPTGVNRDVMQRLIDAARTAFRDRADQVAMMLFDGDSSYLPEAKKLLIALSGRKGWDPNTDMDMYGLMYPTGEDEDAMQNLYDAASWLLNDLWMDDTPISSTLPITGPWGTPFTYTPGTPPTYTVPITDLGGSGGSGNFPVVGPTRSGRESYASVQDGFSGSCLIIAGKSADVTGISPCANVFGDPADSEDINKAMLGVDRLQGIARQHQKPGLDYNYSSNAFSNMPPLGGRPADQILVFFNYLNQTLWSYDPLSGAYWRYNDLADGTGMFYNSTDRITGRQLMYENVIILFIEHDVIKPTIIDIEFLYNRGKAVIFRNGQMYQGVWETVNGPYEQETGRLRPVRILDTAGNPFPLHPGQTWFHIVTPASYAEEQPSGQWRVRFVQP